MNMSKAFTPAPAFLSSLIGIDKVSVNELRRRAIELTGDADLFNQPTSSFSLTYLVILGWVVRPKRGIYSITAAGIQARSLLSDNNILEIVSEKYNQRKRQDEI